MTSPMEAEILLGTLLLRTRRMKLSTLPQRATDLLTRMESAVALAASKHLDDLEGLVVQLEARLGSTPPPVSPNAALGTPMRSGATPA